MKMLPKLLHTYQHHHLDSARWAHFTPRDDDLVVSTPYKSGTTWTQEIVLHLVFLGREVPYHGEVSPWLDNRYEGPTVAHWRGIFTMLCRSVRQSFASTTPAH